MNKFVRPIRTHWDKNGKLGETSTYFSHYLTILNIPILKVDVGYTLSASMFDMRFDIWDLLDDLDFYIDSGIK